MTRNPPRTLRAALAAAALAALAACSSSPPPAPPPYQPGQPVTVDVTGYFAPGSTVTDAYTGTNTVVATSGSVTVTPGSEGLALLEAAGAAPTPFAWKNATVYYAMTDRFWDGDAANNTSYGRPTAGAGDVGSWHGGDWIGLKARLPDLEALGVTALWISPIVEQVHGWVAGGNGAFQHYAYAGYWALDFTMLDRNFGTEAELKSLIDEAHARGIRVLADVVLNHPGYATGQDLLDYLPTVFTDGTGAQYQAWLAAPGAKNWNDFYGFVNFGNGAEWNHWWSADWIRAGFGAPFAVDQSTDLTMQIASLPDFKTESATALPVPDFLTPGWNHPKTPTGAVTIPGATVRDYLVAWQTDWVRRLGFDGFRCDTARNVELASWSALKAAATTALTDWKAANPTLAIDGAPFWMTGEVWDHGVSHDSYYTAGGFDSLINFEFQRMLRDNVLPAANTTLAGGAAILDPFYRSYADAISTTPGMDALSYLSSHDTALFFAEMGYDPVRQRQALSALLLVPGGAQLFYGDESGRLLGPTGGDSAQGTRSDMNWATVDTTIRDHAARVAGFRKRHAAVGAGSHTRLSAPAGVYAFGRKQPGDAVVVVLTKPR